ncbi:MAG: ExbD/TolR family protein [Thermodesulfovibrionales bacterium]
MRVERGRSVLSEINVTPFVDVMLVRLVIFMVTAPLLKQGVDVNLPQAKGKEISAEERLVIVLSKDGSVFLNDKKIKMEVLIEKLRAMSSVNPEVYLEADKDVPYGEVVRLMAEVKEAGIEKLGMVTEPRIDVK